MKIYLCPIAKVGSPEEIVKILHLLKFRWGVVVILKMKMFHEANAPLANGHKRNALLEISDDEFERNHGFIQWAFPTPQQSAQNLQAPVLDLEAAIWLAEKPDVTEFMEQMTVRFLEFLAANHHWKRSYDHNHLRISRVIQSLRVLHSWELANWFYEQVKVFAGDDFELMAKSDVHWAYHAAPLHDRAAGSFVGLAIGDALGAPVSFTGNPKTWTGCIVSLELWRGFPTGKSTGRMGGTGTALQRNGRRQNNP